MANKSFQVPKELAARRSAAGHEAGARLQTFNAFIGRGNSIYEEDAGVWLEKIIAAQNLVDEAMYDIYALAIAEHGYDLSKHGPISFDTQSGMASFGEA